jgi:hypothetical protein
MTAAELNPDLRILIDERLDAIDRTLLGVQVSYSERRSIVAEVETQIFELLSRKTEHPTREDVLAVLDSLDPPESYIPEELRCRLADALVESVPPRPVGPPRPAGPVFSRRAIGVAATLIASGLFIAGVVVGNILMITLAVESNGVIPYLITVAALLYLNYRALPRLWNWYSKRRRTIAEDIRTGLSGWLVPESGAQTS